VVKSKLPNFCDLAGRSFGLTLAIVQVRALLTPARSAANGVRMKNALKCGALVASFIFLAVLPAHADSGDTYSFTLTGPVSASWTMAENPTPVDFESGTVFTADPTNLVVDGAPVSDVLCFFNISDLGGLNSMIVLPDLIGPQIYSGDESNPTFLTGTFYFTNWETGASETLCVTPTPEPTTILLLFSGIAMLGLKRKRESGSLQQ
jgi:hypothetical protein